jgi:hypothetical protein
LIKERGIPDAGKSKSIRDPSDMFYGENEQVSWLLLIKHKSNYI